MSKSERPIEGSKIPDLVTGFLDKIGLSGIDFYVAGSFRRELPTSNDVDLILVKHSDLEFRLIETAIIGEFGHLLTKKERPKMQGSYRDVKFDIHVTSPERFGTMALHATGSWQFNKWLRVQAKAQGLLLNQYAIINNVTGCAVCLAKTEDDVFKYLGLPFIPPVNRSVGCSFPKMVYAKNGYKMMKVTLTKTGYDEKFV